MIKGLQSLFGVIFCSGSRKGQSSFTSIENPIKEKDQAKYLVLDLDETIVYTKVTSTNGNEQATRNNSRLLLSPRPFLTKFLQEVSKYYSIVIYTASMREYAEPVIKALGISKYIKEILDRNDCVNTWDRHITKDLSIIGASMKDVILIDDSLTNSYLQPENFLLIQKYEGQRDDRTLLNLMPFLVELAAEEDVRNVAHKFAEFLKNGPKKNLFDPCMEKPDHETLEEPSSLPEATTYAENSVSSEPNSDPVKLE